MMHFWNNPIYPLLSAVLSTWTGNIDNILFVDKRAQFLSALLIKLFLKKTRLKRFSVPQAAQYLRNIKIYDCLTTAWRLPYNCLTTAWRLPDDCLTTAWQLKFKSWMRSKRCLLVMKKLAKKKCPLCVFIFCSGSILSTYLIFCAFFYRPNQIRKWCPKSS